MEMRSSLLSLHDELLQLEHHNSSRGTFGRVTFSSGSRRVVKRRYASDGAYTGHLSANRFLEKGNNAIGEGGICFPHEGNGD